MGTIDAHIRSVDEAVCENIAVLAANRALLSQNVLSQVRNLVEAIAVRIHLNRGDVDFSYGAIKAALAHVKAQAKYGVLTKFHKLIEISASHYTLDGDASERLMLKYYEYLLRVRNLLRDTCAMDILANLEDFPVDLDPSLQEYHRKIAARIEFSRSYPQVAEKGSRYYIHRVKPFFVDGKVYYEITFCGAMNRVSKFDRIIAFTDIDVTEKYAASLTIRHDAIEVLGQTMPITIVSAWEVSVRPCEFSNFARLFGLSASVQSGSAEYKRLMHYLTTTASSLIDVVELPDETYAGIRAIATEKTQKPAIFPALDAARSLIQRGADGANVVRYLMLRMNNQILKPQFSPAECSILSCLRLQFGCKPFDTMPFCTSLPGHNPRFADLAESLDPAGRDHELLARRVKNNVEQRGILYTPVAELEDIGDVDKLVNAYNRNLYVKHPGRRLERDRGHVFINEFENETVAIIEKLQSMALTGVGGYPAAVSRWLYQRQSLDDPAKIAALKTLFSQSQVALIYGAAGTGKSTMVNHVASYFNERSKLFLAHTNPAVDNLKRKVSAQNATFRTIASQINRRLSEEEYDLLVIDECSTVSNGDLVKVLKKTSFKLLLLVGDVYQIEAIQFGNWFGVVRYFIPPSAVFELTTPFRTTNTDLLNLWGKVRTISDDITEVIARGGYSAVLNQTLFQNTRDDEIILCLNYDGLYGINNVNRFLQSSNPNEGVEWNLSVYKVGDPILFNEAERFRPLIYNNLKGKIVGIQLFREKIRFDVELDRSVDAFEAAGSGLTWVDDSVVRFEVYEYQSSDEDDDSLNTTVPFQVAYAVSIHKAQGLEYDSVKVVITHGSEENVSHSIFYTAITRTREHLKIYWTPETEHKIIAALEHKTNRNDVSILSARRGLTPKLTSRARA